MATDWVENKKVDGGASFREARWPTWAVVVLVAWLAFSRLLSAAEAAWGPWLVAWWARLVVGVVLMHLATAAFVLWTRRRQGGRWRRPCLLAWVLEPALAIPVVIALVFGLTFLRFGLSFVYPDAMAPPESLLRLSESMNPAMIGLFVVLASTIGPVCEEIVFRGFLQNALKRWMPTFAAVLVQSAFFAVLHSYGAFHIALVFLIGVVLTLVYEWRGTLLAPIAVHAGFNAFCCLGVVCLAILHAQQPMLGVVGDSRTERCVVRDVVDGSPADAAGILSGDVILDVNGQPIDDFPKLQATVRAYRAGDVLPIVVERDGQERTIQVELRSRAEVSLLFQDDDPPTPPRPPEE